MKCHVNMKINPNKAIAYVLTKTSTSLDIVSKANITHIVKTMHYKVTAHN